MDTELLQRWRESSKQEFQRIKDAFSRQFFNTFESNQEKLESSLIFQSRQELIGKTLLDEGIHSQHSNELNKLFLSQLKELRNKGLDDRENIRLVTIIHAVSDLDDDSAIVESLRLKELLSQCIDNDQFSFIGVIEGEVINFEKLRRFVRENPDYDARKMLLSETLNVSGTDKSMFLVHVHGCLFSKTGGGFETVDRRFRNIWSNSYQTDLKRLYSQKTTAENLMNISRYITKGGQDFDNDRLGLKFKMGFTSDDLETRMSYHSKKRQHDHLDVETGVVEQDKIEDTRSLNRYEIAALASFVDKLMDLDAGRTGYRVII